MTKEKILTMIERIDRFVCHNPSMFEDWKATSEALDYATMIIESIDFETVDFNGTK
jgi:hypothetical protein